MIHSQIASTNAFWVTLFVLLCPVRLPAQTSLPPARYETGILAAADTLNSMTQQNGMQQVIRLGLFDGSSPYNFNWSLQSQCPEGVLPSKCCQPGQSSAGCVPLVPVVRIAQCNRVSYQVQVRNVTSDFRLFVGSQAATVAPDPADPSQTLATVSPVSALAGPLIIQQGGQGVYNKPLIVEHVDIGCDLGGFVIPYVLLAIVYEPPGSSNLPPDTGSQASYSTTSTMGTTVSWDSLVSKGNVKTDDTQDFLRNIIGAMKLIGVVAGAGGGGGAGSGSPGGTIGDIGGAVQQAIPDTTTTTTLSTSFASSGSTGWSISQTDAYKTAAHKYPGQGDVIVIMRDLLVAYATLGDKIILAPLAYADILPLPVYQLSQFSSSDPVWLNFVQQAQALDLELHPAPYPSAANPTYSKPGGQTHDQAQRVVLPGHYMTYVHDYPCPSGSEFDHDVSRDEITSTGQSQTTTQTVVTKVSGKIAELMGYAGQQSWSMSYTSSKTQWQGQAVAAGLKLFCPDYPPYGIWVRTYFDSLFGTFVPFVGQPISPNAPAVAGTGASPSQPITLNAGGNRYTVVSQADGTFSFPVSSLPKGSGWVTAGSTKIPISYNGTPLTLNLKVGAVAISTANLGKNVNPPTPCCPVTGIDTATGVVTAKVSSTGQYFQFTVKDSALFHSLKIGQAVFANFETKQVSINGKDVCCQIVNLASAQAAGIPATTANTPANQNPAGQARSNGACCRITDINQQTGIVIAKVNATGQTFEFGTSPQLLPSLKIGQVIYANLKNKQVSLDGTTICCNIVAIGAGGGNAGGQKPQAGKPESASVSPGPFGTGKPIGVNPLTMRTEQIDPCTIGTASQLQILLNGAMGNYFPIAMQNEGEHIQLSDPKVTQATCPNLTIAVWVQVKYEQTRGLIQFQAGGNMTIQSPLIAVIEYQPIFPMDRQVRADNLYRAFATLTNPQITSLKIDNVPSWLDTTWLRDCLNGKYSNWGCTDRLHAMTFDVTDLVRTYLSLGHTLPGGL